MSRANDRRTRLNQRNFMKKKTLIIMSNGKGFADLQSSSNQEKEITSSTKEKDEANSSELHSNRFRKKNNKYVLLANNTINENSTDSDGTTDYTEPNKIDIPYYELQTKLPFECSYCSERFKYQKNRNNHENFHTGKLPQCPKCLKIFLAFEKLTEHLKLHKIKLQCKLCSKEFFNQKRLEVHIRLKHQQPPKIVPPCLLCAAKFKTLFHLKLHMEAHQRRSQTYTCEYCQRQFKNRKLIVQHMKIHSGIMPHKCDKCGKAFVRKHNKRKHERKCSARVSK